MTAARTVIDIDNRIDNPFVAGDEHADWQAGQLWATPNIRKTLPYTLIGGNPASIAGAAAALDTMLHTECALGPVDVYGHSAAAQVICKWLRDYGPTSTLPTTPSNLRFLLAANPEHRFNGLNRAATGYNLYGGNGYPLTTPFSVWEMTRQYDIYGDSPLDTSNPFTPAMLNVGGVPLGPGFLYVHADYVTTPFFDPGPNSGYVTWNDPDHPNLHYIYARTYPLPSLRFETSSDMQKQKDREQRPQIEAAYYRTTGSDRGRPVAIPNPVYDAAAFGEPFTGTDHDDFSAWARELREYRIERAHDRPGIMLYDGDWVYRGTVYGEINGSCSPIVNETGLIKITLPIDMDDPRRTWAAFWALDEEARGTTNIHIRIETMGARICGRMKAKNGVTVTRGPDGDEVTIDFLDDIEELKFVHTAGNPFLPISLIQQPKAWMLLLQADHAILLTMACNLLRLQLTNVDIDSILQLLDPANWTLEGVVDALLGFWQQSQIVIKPRNFGDSAAPLALVVGSIRTSIFDVAAPILEDAEMQWDLRRWFTGDPEPWPGAGTGWRNGTLMVGIVDKSGFRTGTSLGGNLLTGLTRTIASVLSNHVEDSYDLFTGETIDETGYRLPGFLGTLPAHPYVVYRDGDVTGIQTSSFSRSPGGPGRITVGGQSMPGVNELIKAAINYGGDVLGDNLGTVISVGVGFNVNVGSLGGALNAFLEPIYKDSILAHISVPLLLRVSKQGWGHYLETNSSNVTQAFTAASIMDLRARRRETDPDTDFTLQVANASPWLIGDNGYGHWWLGDRVGGTQKYLMPRVFVRRCRQLDINWGESKGLTIEATFGDTRNEKDAIERLTELVAKSMTGLQEIGLW